MWPQLYEWIALFIKWFHITCGIAWIGASFYFTWLDNSLKTPPEWKKKKGIKGDLWAVHGGGFYEVAKYQVGPEQMPEKLHWFKWEAYATWLTGTALLIWMYYFNAQAYLIDPRVMALSTHQAVLFGMAGIFLGVCCYEALVRSPLSAKPWLFLLSLIVIGGGFFYLFSSIYSGRGAFIHMGALIGSIMVNNVWHKIIPGQRKMVAQVAAGEDVDPGPGLEGKRRSIHNNYFTLPILFLMISNHYPIIYQHAHNWLVGMMVMLISAWVRHFFNLKHQGQFKPEVLISGCAAMLVMAIALSWPQTQLQPLAHSHEHSQPAAEVLTPQAQQALDIVQKRCSSCHSQQPTDEVFTIAPGGAAFDNWQDVQRWSPRIIARAVDSADMPFMNKTEMTEQERETLRQLLATQ
ncbi:urate hydroxylase PuuD [Aliagarivorans marinus]|uniref:urate hydroxylase PuuD n=1 Tax=Aliagarivorans marinus TaxID=561965 RepID=UPI000479F4FB|nr:urate hydroxylase PuuD [Aliagarivorans marinus]